MRPLPVLTVPVLTVPLLTVPLLAVPVLAVFVLCGAPTALQRALGRRKLVHAPRVPGPAGAGLARPRRALTPGSAAPGR